MKGYLIDGQGQDEHSDHRLIEMEERLLKQQFETKENPLIFHSFLAMKIGIREAVILQQIHDLLTKSSHVIERRRWTYNTYKDWQMQFPFWSEMSIKRSILNLEKQGILLSANWNLLKIDRTKWYTIEYEKIAQLELPLLDPLKDSPKKT